MSSDNQEAQTIFTKAVEIVDPAERSRFVDEACAGNAALRREVDSLLSAHSEAGQFLRQPARAARAPAQDTESMPPLSEARGTRIGNYKLLEKIGEGGFGVVWMAEQEEPVRRRVALKIIKLGMDTREVVARFEAERQALAMMDHPNIARVFDGGATDTGRPYFVMELVRGLPITDYCDQTNLPTRERLELFMQVCKAVQHAHQKGIIHRDLKPSNILVATPDGVPVPKVIDFGIAKAIQQRLTDKTLFTAFTQFIGTPAYISPEQAGGSALDVDTRSDIYSLGVLLYELLTGHTPFDAETLIKAGVDSIRRILREADPSPPSNRLSTLDGEALTEIAKRRQAEVPKLLHAIRGDLDWIVMRCLEKDRRRRYATANGLAMDLKRHLNQEPVDAGPPTLAYRFKKGVVRHKVTCGIAAIVAGVVAVGLIVSVTQAVRATRAEREQSRLRAQAEAAEADARSHLWDAFLGQARALREGGRSGQRLTALEILAQARPLRTNSAALLALRNETVACLALPDMRTAHRLPSGATTKVVGAIDRGFETYATASDSGVVVVRRVADALAQAELPMTNRVVWVMRFSDNGAYLATKSTGPGGEIADVWDVRAETKRLSFTNAMVHEAFAFHPYLPQFALGTRDGSIRVFDLETGMLRTTLNPDAVPRHLAYSPEGRSLAISHQSRHTVVLVDPESGVIQQSLDQGTLPRGMAWHASGRVLAVAGDDGYARTWDTRQGKLLTKVGPHEAQVTQVALNRRGDRLASQAWDASLYLWDLRSGERLMKTAADCSMLTFDPTDRLLGVAKRQDTIDLFEVADSTVCRTPSPAMPRAVNDAAFSRRGHLLAVAASEAVFLWTLDEDNPPLRLPFRDGKTVEFINDDRALMVVSRSELGVWPIDRTVDNKPAVKPGSPEVYPVKTSSQYDLVPGTTRIWIRDPELCRQLSSGTSTAQITTSRHPRLTFLSQSPDRRWVATGTWQGKEVLIWDQAADRIHHRLPINETAGVLFSGDGRWLATASPETVQLWEVGWWQWHHAFPIERGIWFFRMAFSPDGSILALRHSTEQVKLVSTETGEEIVSLPGQSTSPLCFSSDGRYLTVADEVSGIKVWDLRTLQTSLAARGLDWAGP